MLRAASNRKLQAIQKITPSHNWKFSGRGQSADSASTKSPRTQVLSIRHLDGFYYCVSSKIRAAVPGVTSRHRHIQIDSFWRARITFLETFSKLLSSHWPRLSHVSFTKYSLERTGIIKSGSTLEAGDMLTFFWVTWGRGRHWNKIEVSLRRLKVKMSVSSIHLVNGNSIALGVTHRVLVNIKWKD